MAAPPNPSDTQPLVCMFSPPCSVWSSMSDQQWRMQSPVSALTWRRLQVFLSHRLLLVSWQQAVHVQLHCQPGDSPQLHLCYSVWLYVCWYITDSKHNPFSLFVRMTRAFHSHGNVTQWMTVGTAQMNLLTAVSRDWNIAVPQYVWFIITVYTVITMITAMNSLWMKHE